MYRSSTMGRWGGSILILVGLLQLALGAGFVLALGGLPYAGGGMMLTGGILFVVGVGLIIAGVIWLRRSADKDRISTTGLAGTGQITGLTQTGMMVNNQPVVKIEMLITVPGRQPYPASVQEIVPLILLGSLGQGALPVRVDPVRPDKIVVQWDQVGVGSAPFSQPAPLAPNDETLGQVAAALPAAAGAAPVFAQPGQAGVSIDQLAPSSGPPGERRRPHRRAPGQRPDRGQRAPVHDDHDDLHPRADPVHERPLGRDGPAGEGAPHRRRGGAAGQGRARQSRARHVRVGPDLSAATR